MMYVLIRCQVMRVKGLMFRLEFMLLGFAGEGKKYKALVHMAYKRETGLAQMTRGSLHVCFLYLLSRTFGDDRPLP